MSVSIPRFFGNRASLQPGQTDAPAGPPSTTPAPADDAKTRGGRFIGRLKQVARRKPVTPVPATTKPNDKLRSAAVSATAYRAGEFFDAHKNSAQTLPQLKLAAAGLECRGNTGESMRMSFAHALIQHAVGSYGSLENASERLKHDVAQEIDKLIKEFTPVAGKKESPKANTMLERINRAFPHARLNVRVIDGDTGENSWTLTDSKLGALAMRDPNEVLLFYQDKKFEAIVADSKKLTISPAPESCGVMPADYSENIFRAANAGTKIRSFLNLEKSKKREGPDFGGESRPGKTDESVLKNALTPLNIERIASDAPDEISLVTGLLRLASGIHEKNDFPTHVHSITDAEPLHALEAREILTQLDAHLDPKTYFKPAGLTKNDTRVSEIIEVINQRYKVNLNVMLVEAREDGLHMSAMYSAESGGNTLKLDHEDSSATTLVLLRNGDSFEPLRRSAIKTNPYLQPAVRNAHKSFYGNVKAKTADVISLGRRNQVRNMSDDELEFQRDAHGSGMKRAMENELNKRQDADRVDIGIQTLNERRKLWFRHAPPETNKYTSKSAEKLVAKLNPPKDKPKLSPREERLARLALHQKQIAANHPNAMQSLPR